MSYELFIRDAEKEIPIVNFWGATKDITICQALGSSEQTFTLTQHIFARDNKNNIISLLDLIKKNKPIKIYFKKSLIYSGIDLNPYYVIEAIEKL